MNNRYLQLDQDLDQDFIRLDESIASYEARSSADRELYESIFDDEMGAWSGLEDEDLEDYLN